MAVTLKKKVAGKVEIISARQLAALEAVGLGPIEKKTTAAMAGLGSGVKVVVTNDMFFWRKDYKPGDTGTITRSWNAPESPFTIRPKDDIYEVELDIARGGEKKILLSRWEIEEIKEEVTA